MAFLTTTRLRQAPRRAQENQILGLTLPISMLYSTYRHSAYEDGSVVGFAHGTAIGDLSWSRLMGNWISYIWWITVTMVLSVHDYAHYILSF